MIIPATPAVIWNFVLPLMLGAKDVAFPRLNLASFHIYMAGATLFFISMRWARSTRAGPSTPRTAHHRRPGRGHSPGSSPGLLVHLDRSELHLTIHKMRAPGMT